MPEHRPSRVSASVGCMVADDGSAERLCSWQVHSWPRDPAGERRTQGGPGPYSDGEATRGTVLIDDGSVATEELLRVAFRLQAVRTPYSKLGVTGASAGLNAGCLRTLRRKAPSLAIASCPVCAQSDRRKKYLCIQRRNRLTVRPKNLPQKQTTGLPIFEQEKLPQLYLKRLRE